MAKGSVTLTCSECGCEFVKTKFCVNRKEADGWEAWMASHGPWLCPGCYKEHARAEERRKNDEAISATGATLPPLTGTEKQVAWAEDIRAQAIARVVRNLKDGVDKPAIVADLCAGKTEAKWWIDTRYSSFSKERILVALIRTCPASKIPEIRKMFDGSSLLGYEHPDWIDAALKEREEAL